MKAALHAEWTKLRTVAAPRWLLLALIASTATSTRFPIIGTQLSQAPAALLGALIMGGEFTSNLIHPTLTAIPRRAILFAAKTIIVTTVVAAASAAVAGGAVAGSSAVAASGAVAGGGAVAGSSAVASGGAGGGAEGVVRGVFYLGLVALLGLGLTTVARDPATGVGVALALLYLPPLLATTLGDPAYQRLTPAPANLPATAAWALGTAAVAALLLLRRDAGNG